MTLVGLEHGFIVPYQLGMSSSQLTRDNHGELLEDQHQPMNNTVVINIHKSSIKSWGFA